MTSILIGQRNDMQPTSTTLGMQIVLQDAQEMQSLFTEIISLVSHWCKLQVLGMVVVSSDVNAIVMEVRHSMNELKKLGFCMKQNLEIMTKQQTLSQFRPIFPMATVKTEEATEYSECTPHTQTSSSTCSATITSTSTGLSCATNATIDNYNHSNDEHINNSLTLDKGNTSVERGDGSRRLINQQQSGANSNHTNLKLQPTDGNCETETQCFQQSSMYKQNLPQVQMVMPTASDSTTENGNTGTTSNACISSKTHNTGMTGPRWRCKVCGKGFLYKFQFKTHMLSHDGLYSTGGNCSKFVTKIATPDNKLSSIVGSGLLPGGNSHLCFSCGRAFSNRFLLLRHEKTHGQRPYSCEECGKRFSRQYHLQNHLTLHSGLRPFQCTACDKHYARKDHLDRHIRKNHMPHLSLQVGDLPSQVNTSDNNITATNNTLPANIKQEFPKERTIQHEDEATWLSACIFPQNDQIS